MDQGIINTYLHTFISPVTGRLPLSEDLIIVGDENGIGSPSTRLIDLELDLIRLREDYNLHRAANFILGFPNSEAPNAQVLSKLENGFLYNTEGIVSTTSVIPGDSLVLPYGEVYVGNINNRAAPSQTITINNLPNLTYKKILRGDITDRPIESDDLTNTESTIGDILSDIANILSILSSLQSLLNTLSQTVSGLAAAVAALQTQILALIVSVTALQAQIDNLTVTLEGDVIGGGSIYEPIQTTLTLTLDKIPLAVDSVNLNNQKIINLQAEIVDQFDAINANFIWELFHNRVQVIWPQ